MRLAARRREGFLTVPLRIAGALVVAALGLHWTHPVWSQRLAIAGFVQEGGETFGG